MKTLILIRHAKSCWNNNLEDFERPIKKRGITDANIVSNALIDSNIKPDLILCSTANRTKQTATIFIENLGLAQVNIKYLSALYDFSGDLLTNVVKSIDDLNDYVIIFGHNYALTHFVNTYGNIAIENVTTSGFVKITFKISTWKNLCKGKTQKIVFPKQLK